ncbi:MULTISPECIES: hypothetical protein [Pantoea]|uniref:hypothetical protein n=1 Tax=Pantoea TaxID=53335 RepID=UPI00289301BC|nr:MULTISPECIES: hypothetical protein [unclassified Pantoea]MCG7388019.1 hypothetical protein [Pantoea sp. ACRSB]
MSLFTALLTGGWHWIAVIGALIAALGASYFGGKKIGKVQQQAKADTESAKKEAAQTAAVAHQQQLHREEATRVTTDNSNLDDAAARDKLQQSKYNKP